MFDLDLIEQVWKSNSFRLSEEEIIEIYRLEGVTLSKYEEECAKVGYNSDLLIEEKLLQAAFGNVLEEHDDKLVKELKPGRKHLSEKNQKKVVEGCLYMVFNETRYWYDFFKENLSMEEIYYVCLQALMNSVKYILHCEKPVFRFYVLKSIERNVIKYVGQYLHIPYRNVRKMIPNRFKMINSSYALEDKQLSENLELSFVFKRKEKVEKPSKIHYQLRNECYSIDYIKNISSAEFMNDYSIALECLDDLSKTVMKLTFDSSGYRGLTDTEIADYLGIDQQKVSGIRKKAIKVLRKDINLSKYL